ACSAEAATGEGGSAGCEAEGYPEGYRILDDSPIEARSSSSSSSRCGVCRCRGGVDEVVLELWDEYVREDEKAGGGGGGGGGGGRGGRGVQAAVKAAAAAARRGDRALTSPTICLTTGCST
ncbi:unnamed protein product, partial [Ectocarpus sp. 13 AM-2016]